MNEEFEDSNLNNRESDSMSESEMADSFSEKAPLTPEDGINEQEGLDNERTIRFRQLIQDQTSEEIEDDRDELKAHQTHSPQPSDSQPQWNGPPLSKPADEMPTVTEPPQGSSIFSASNRSPYPAPPIDASGMDLIHPVPERDLGATRVGKAAYIPPSGPTPPNGMASRRRRDRPSRPLGCFIRMTILALFALFAGIILIASYGIYQYNAIAATLPTVEDLRAHAAQFETTRILDRQGNQLYEILDPQAGRRTYVQLEDISPYMVAATVATEDSQFYSHPGYDLLAIARAIWQNLSEGETVSGASTITQQLTRNLLLGPEEASRRTAKRKIREILLAAEVTRRYTKDEILELYLNQWNYGNLAYGVEAASQTYFATSADKLTLAQASFLAGLSQAPSVYDIYTNREATLNRQRQVLTLMVEASKEQGCILISNSQQPVCVSPEEAGAAAAEITNYDFKPLSFPMRFPHWVNFIKAELEQMYDPQTIYRSGFTVYTTLDPDLQAQAQQIVQEQIESLADHRVSTGALVAIRPSTGEILALVGSADFDNEEIDGQVNMAIRPRQPGSSLKPLTYTAAFEKGWSPATLIWDVPSEFPPSGNPSDPRPPYKPVNYDGRFHGPATVRSALANSFNVPAVKTLDFVGIYDDPATPEEEGLVAFANRMGITTFNRDDYGLSLTLGGGDVTLLELTSAYTIYANNGLSIPPVAIARIEDHTGEIVYQYDQPKGEQVIQPTHAYLITDILSDNQARTPMFGANSALNLPFQAAAKTGTTNDFRDNWTLGFTPDITIGVWVGNADYTPMQNTSGLTGAAPIWNKFMQYAVQRLTGGQPTPFTRPLGIEEHVICTVSGAEPSEWCPSHRIEIFAADQPPLPKEQDLWQQVYIDSWTLKLASSECADHLKEKLGLNVNDPWARKWILEDKHGQDWADEMDFPEDKVFFIPDEICATDDPQPTVSLTSPSEGAMISEGPVEIFGQASATGDFKDWVLQYGRGFDPDKWIRIKWSDTAYQKPEKLEDWELADIENGPITLRLVVRNKNGGNAEARIHLNLNLATPTPTTTMTPTTTATSTPTPTATPTPSISPTPTLSATSTSTPSLTPTPTPTP